MKAHLHPHTDPSRLPRLSRGNSILLLGLAIGLHGVVLYALLRSESVSQPAQVSAPVAVMLGTLVTQPSPVIEPEPAPEPEPEPKPDPKPAITEPTSEPAPEPTPAPKPDPKPAITEPKAKPEAKPLPRPTVKKSPPQTKARPTNKAVESLSTVQHSLSDLSQAEKVPKLATNPVPVQTPPPVVQPRLDARAGNNRPPDYPRAARKRGQEGTVVLSLVIGADGSVQNVSVERSSGYPLLDQSAVKAIRRWHFHPATQEGKAISWNYVQPIKFSLTD